MYENEITSIVDEIMVKVQEDENEFIFQTIRPYCEEVLERRINKKELNAMISKPEAIRKAAVNDLGLRIAEEYVNHPETFSEEKIMELTSRVINDTKYYRYYNSEEDDGK